MERLLDALQDECIEVRKDAAEALGEIGVPGDGEKFIRGAHRQINMNGYARL